MSHGTPFVIGGAILALIVGILTIPLWTASTETITIDSLEQR